MRDRVIPPLVLIVGACGSSGPKVALRYHPPAGSVYRFGSEQKTTVHADSGPLAAMGKRQMVLRFYFTQTVKGSTADGIEVEVLFETVSMEVPGLPSNITGNALAGIQGARATMVLDPRGAVVRSDFTGARGGVSPEVGRRLAAGVNTVAFGFPEQPVGQGDSWTVKSELPLDDMPGITASTSEVARTTLTVREIRIEGTDTSVVLDVKTEFPREPIHLTSAGESGTIKLEGGMTGRQVFSITRGALVDATITGTATMTLSGSGIRAGGMSVQTETENSVVLLPD